MENTDKIELEKKFTDLQLKKKYIRDDLQNSQISFEIRKLKQKELIEVNKEITKTNKQLDEMERNSGIKFLGLKRKGSKTKVEIPFK